MTEHPQLWNAGPVKICRGDRTQQARDHAKILDGRNRERMRRRQAAKHGLTYAGYLARKAEAQNEQARQSAATHANRCYRTHHRLRGAVNPEAKRRARAAYMNELYHADPTNWSTYRKRRRIFERDNYRCRVCGKKVQQDLPNGHPDKAVAMHILAKATGGPWSKENMATGCWECNVKDGVNRLPIPLTIENFVLEE